MISSPAEATPLTDKDGVMVEKQDEMKAIFERYQKVAGYHVQQVSRPRG